MANLNSITLAGNLTRDPELRTLPNGSAVANFGLAINRRWKGSDGETKEETTFIDIECWGRTGELASQYLRKGSSCLIQGRIKFETWDDKDGGKRSRHKAVAETLQFLDRAGARDDHAGDSNNAAPASATSNRKAPAASASSKRPRQMQANGYATEVVLDEPPF